MKNKLALVSEADLSLVDSNSLNGKQLKVLLKRTPKQYIKTRPAKGGGTWEYVTGGYVKKCLNLMFGWDWDFEILDEKILIEAKEVIVKGKLTCRSNGKTIVKMQYGNKDIIFRKGTTIPLSIGNDMKSASTDALKKCASEIGIASDIYNKEDFREINVDTEAYTLERLKKLFDESTLSSVDDSLYIERIIDEKEESSYKKAILTLEKL
jgi:hypothetical protein